MSVMGGSDESKNAPALDSDSGSEDEAVVGNGNGDGSGEAKPDSGRGVGNNAAKKPGDEEDVSASPPSIQIKEEMVSAAPLPQSAGASPRSSGHSPNHSTEADAEDDPDKDKTEAETSFPLLLHAVVTDPATDYCVHWLPCGTRFMISDKKKFATDVLPRFHGQAKFTSFTRRLKRWSFSRVPSGPNMGAYYNANFRRGAPELAVRVKYDQPLPLSGAAMKAQLRAAAAMGGGAGAGGGLFANPLWAQMPLSSSMSMVHGGGAGPFNMNMLGLMGTAGAGSAQNNMESLFRAMGHSFPPNLAAANNTVALQMAMAQAMMQQQPQQLQGQAQLGNVVPFAQLQQQNQMTLLANAANSGLGMPGQVAPMAQNQEEQRLLAQLQQLQQQQQQNHQQGLGSMSTIASLTPSMVSNPSGGLSNFNYGALQAPNAAAFGQQGLTSKITMLQSMPTSAQASSVSLKTLKGDALGNNPDPTVGPQLQLSYPNSWAREAGGPNPATGNYLPQNMGGVGDGGGGDGNLVGVVGNQGDANQEQNTTQAFC